MASLVRLEWGLQGLEKLKTDSDVFVIVDVLSFTTSVDIGTSRGASIYPFGGFADNAADFANQQGALLAGSSRKSGYSLSPASLVGILPGTKLVLPSPNGSTLSLATGSTPTLAGSLRNARAVAAAAARMGDRISVIASGERWRDGSLRPAIEDLLGAGAIIAELDGQNTPEAEMARLSFEAACERLSWFLEQCNSGQELIGLGRSEDVRLAGELGVSSCVPLLRDQAYQNVLQ